MNDVSELIKSAKPLYIERKKTQRKIQQTCLSLFMILSVIISGFCGYEMNSLKTSYIASSDTNISESYFPVDDYGLITVKY